MSEETIRATAQTTSDYVKIVLVAPSHPGNIGAAARAMKTMGLSQLRLVQPARFPALEATARASGADDVLERAEVYDTLGAAVADCVSVFGTSARARSMSWPLVHPRDCAQSIAAAAHLQQPVAILFGREHAGLTNDELEYCQAVVRIPTAGPYSSLNVAAAVQILTYEVLQARNDAAVGGAGRGDGEALASSAEKERLQAHLEQIMTLVGFFDPSRPKLLLRRMRRLFNRSGLETAEVQILRGFLTAIQKRLN